MREEGDYSGLIEENTSPTNILVSKDLTGRPALHYKPVTFFCLENDEIPVHSLIFSMLQVDFIFV